MDCGNGDHQHPIFSKACICANEVGRGGDSARVSTVK